MDYVEPLHYSAKNIRTYIKMRTGVHLQGKNQTSTNENENIVYLQ